MMAKAARKNEGRGPAGAEQGQDAEGQGNVGGSQNRPAAQ